MRTLRRIGIALLLVSFLCHVLSWSGAVVIDIGGFIAASIVLTFLHKDGGLSLGEVIRPLY